jgi:hypothetical protein
MAFNVKKKKMKEKGKFDIDTLKIQLSEKKYKYKGYDVIIKKEKNLLSDDVSYYAFVYGDNRKKLRPYVSFSSSEDEKKARMKAEKFIKYGDYSSVKNTLGEI